MLHVNMCIYMYLSNPSHDIFIKHPLVYYHIFNSTGNFKKVLSATTLCQAVPFDFECTFVKQYFGQDKSHGLDYYEFSQLLQVHCIYICFSKRDTFFQNYFDQLLTLNCPYTLYRKSMKFGIQEELLLGFLGTKFCLLCVQNCGMTSN